MKKIASLLLIIFICTQITVAQDHESSVHKKAKISISDFYARSELGLSQKRNTFLRSPAYSITQTFGYKINSHFQVGIGVSRERYYIGGDIHLMSIFTEAMGFLSRTGASPYGSLRVGAGFGLNEPSYSSSNTPGILLNPEIGIRCPIWSFDFMLGIGVKIQNIDYHFNEYTDYQYTRKYKIRRPELRLGLMF